jgi:hypothetical protein
MSDPISFANQELEELLRRVRAGSIDAEADIKEMFAALTPALPDGEAVAYAHRGFLEPNGPYRRDFEENGTVVYHQPMGTATLPLYASPPPASGEKYADEGGLIAQIERDYTRPAKTV